jgi:hypothetical protein
MGHPNGAQRGGVNPAKAALRDALRCYVWQHLNKFPALWFSEVELARVIQEQYIGDPRPPSCGAYHYGRANAVTKALVWLEDRGEAERSNVPWPNRPGCTRRVWRACQPAR